MSATALTLAAVLAMAARPECGGSLGVEPSRVAAVAQVESKLEPLTIHVNGSDQVLHPATAEEAANTAASLIADRRSIDIGLMQINNAQLRGLALRTAFDACANMAAAVIHMKDDYDAVWTLAHRRYNCGRTDCSADYAARIQAVRDQIEGKVRAGVAASPVVAAPSRPVCPAPDPTGWHIRAMRPDCDMSPPGDLGWHVKATLTATLEKH